MKGPFWDRCQVIISDSLKLLTLLPTFHRHQVFWHGFSYVQICFWSCGIFWEMEKKIKRGWLPSFANWWMNLVCPFCTVSYRPHLPSHLTKMLRSTHICALILLKSAISSPLHKKRESNGFDLHEARLERHFTDQGQGIPPWSYHGLLWRQCFVFIAITTIGTDSKREWQLSSVIPLNPFHPKGCPIDE